MVTLSDSVAAAGIRVGLVTRRYASFSEMMNATDTLVQGQELRWGPHRYIVAASGASDHHLTRADGTKLYVQRGERGFNALAFGAVGDGSTVTVAALQACYDAAGRRNFGMFIPGQDSYYNLGTTSLILSDVDANRKVVLTGEGNASWLYASIADGAVIDRATVAGGAGGQGVCAIHNLRVTNIARTANGTAWGIRWGGSVGAFSIKDCFIQAESGIRYGGFTTTIHNVSLQGSVERAGIGLLGGGHASVSGVDIMSFGEGIRISGTNTALSGCRLEINTKGLVIGKDPDNVTTLTDRTHISGMSFEANDIGIDLWTLTGTISGIAIQGGPGAPSGQATNGIIVRGGNASISNVRFLSSFSDATISILGGSTVYEQILAENFFNPDRPAWDVRTTNPQTFIRCNYEPGNASEAGGPYNNLFNSVIVGGLAHVDFRNPPKIPKNLCDVGVPVADGSTSAAILFPPDRAVSVAHINTSSATTGGTLDAGTYYYLATVLNRNGESGQDPAQEVSVVVDGSNNAVQVNFFGSGASDYVRRIYRRSASTGLYDGYFDHPAGSSQFVDSGQAFSGSKQPAANGISIVTCQEPDANYGVIVTPSWGTTAWVTNKATSGFTINFGTAAPAGATVDWILMR